MDSNKRILRAALRRLASLVRPAAKPVSLGDVLANPAAKTVLDQFHALWYASDARAAMRWMGHPIRKNPFDLWTYQEIIVAAKPDVIVETGTYYGGSALFFSDISRIAGHPADVITVDCDPRLAYDPAPHRITVVRGRSTADATVAQVTARLDARATPPSVMVVLDSDHSKQNVLAELARYAPLVTPGQWLVVEDTNLNGHPVLPEYGAGPFEAVSEFLASHPPFTVDPGGERLLLTHNPRGWLRREPG